MSTVSLISASPLEKVLPLSFPSRNTLGGRIVSNWRNIILGTGIAIAAAGAIVCFSMQAIVTAIAFVALGIILVFAAYYVKNFDSDLAMRKNIQILKDENQQLKTDNQNMQKAAETLEQEDTRIQQINRDMTQHIQQMQRQADELQRTNIQLTQNNQTLQGTSQTLQQSKDALQQKTDAIQQAIPLLQAQVDRFFDENQTLGRHTGLFHQDLDSFARDNDHIDHALTGFNQAVDHDVVTLAQSIKRSHALSQTLIGTWRKQKEELTAELGAFHAASAKARTIDTDLAQRVQELSSLETRIQNRTQSITQLEDQLQSTEEALSQETAQLEKVRNEFSAVQEGLATEKTGMEEVERRLQSSVYQLSALESILTKNVEENLIKKKNLEQELDKRINEKTEALKKVKAEIAAAGTASSI